MRRSRYAQLMILAVVASAGVALAATPAGAAAGTVMVAPAVTPAGGTVAFSGSVSTSQCPVSDEVTLTSSAALFPPDGFGPMVGRNAAGAFSTAYTVPASTPPGSYHVGLRCAGGNVGVSTTLQVTAQVSRLPSSAPQAGLGGASRGGAPRAAWVAAGAILLLLAALASVALGRRSRSS